LSDPQISSWSSEDPEESTKQLLEGHQPNVVVPMIGGDLFMSSRMPQRNMLSRETRVRDRLGMTLTAGGNWRARILFLFKIE
jgi:hypothetical protein